MPNLIQLFQEMHELTLPKCGECRVPHSCCDKFACSMTREIAKDLWNVNLPFDDEKDIPYLNPDGSCQVAPHLRPHCTYHTCAINGLGTSGDLDWDRKYFDLREKIDKEELKKLGGN